MKQHENRNRKNIILWAKRVTAFATVIIWVTVLYNIFLGGGNFNDQAPKCIASTMIIFGILTAVYKGLELWEKRS